MLFVATLIRIGREFPSYCLTGILQGDAINSAPSYTYLNSWHRLLCMLQTQHEETERAAAEVAQAQAELAAVRKRQLEQIAGATCRTAHVALLVLAEGVFSSLHSSIACRLCVHAGLRALAAACEGRHKMCHIGSCRHAVLKQLFNVC